MKNKILFFISLLFFASGSFAQVSQVSTANNGFASLNEAAKMAEQIVSAAGRKANFLIAEAPVPNALAVVFQGKRYILYNPNFINALGVATGTKWAAVSVLAHEIGHHLNSKNSSSAGLSMATELEADEFSGFVLEKMGASLSEAQAAIKLLATTYATSTHPGRDDRVSSIALGWQKAGGMVTEDEEPAGISMARASTPAGGLPSGIIAATIYFNSSPDELYYITKRMNVVKVDHANISIIGQLARSDSKQYPYIIYDGSGYRLYITASGSIVNRDGKTVGQIKINPE